MLIDIIIAFADKILPLGIKKFIPLIKIQPKKLKFVKSEWTSNLSFFLYNRSNQVLFDIYLLIEIGDAKTENFELTKAESSKNIEIAIDKIIINYEILRLNCIYENGQEFILLKVAQIDPESFVPFQIKANTDSEVKFKILKSSKKQPGALNQKQAMAITFEIPIKKKGQIRLKNISILMKRND